MGRSRTTHAGHALTEKQDRFVRLIAQGVSNSEACRVVGINRRTGTRWRFGRTILNTAGEAVQYPPVRISTPPTARHPRYLSLAERTVIADLRARRRNSSTDRDGDRPRAVHGQPGTTPQRRPVRSLPASRRGPARRRAAASST
jgi:hypothetical protein